MQAVRIALYLTRKPEKIKKLRRSRLVLRLLLSDTRAVEANMDDFVFTLGDRNVAEHGGSAAEVPEAVSAPDDDDEQEV